MTAPALYIPDILEEHLEELGFLWGQRRAALRSPLYSPRAFTHLEERIVAHLDGVLADGELALPLLEDTLAGEDFHAVFAAAYSLLNSKNETAATRVVEAFARAEGAALMGLRDALCHAPCESVLPRLNALARGVPNMLAVVAAEVLAFHGGLEPTAPELQRFLRADDPALRLGGWRVAACLGARLDAKKYAAALRDDPPVRRAALAAGAWSGEPGILAVGRKFAENPAPDHLDALELLAVLAGPEDLPRVAALGRATPLGPARFRLLGCFGHPATIETVLAGLGDPDPATAAAAGAAFTKLTGAEIASQTRAKIPLGGPEPDAFEMEFLDEVTLPSPELAHRVWDKVKERLALAPRICRGFDLGRGLSREALAVLDMESRWETCLRARFRGEWTGSLLTLERLPQRW